MARDATRAALPRAPRVRLGPDVRADLEIALSAFALSRIVVWGAGMLAIAIWGVPAAKQRAFDPAGLTHPLSPLGDLLVAPAARWDATWYLTIADQGYDHATRTAFFPLYPLLVHVGGVLAAPVLAAVLLSCACFVVALALLHRLAVLEIGPQAARWAVLALALFPGALWFSAAYSESLFLLVSVGAVLAARTDHWARAGLLGALAATTRSAGVLLLVPLMLLWWGTPRRPRDVAWLALVPAGLLAYCAGLAAEGHPFDAPFQAQDVWHRTFAGPLAGLRDGAVAGWDGARQLLHGSPEPVFFTKAAGDPMAIGRHNLMLFAFLLLGLWLLAGALRRLAPAHGAYAALALLLPLSYPVGPQPLMSLPRFLAVLYPLFLWLGWWLARGPAWRPPVVLGLFAVGLGAFSMLFATWLWVA